MNPFTAPMWLELYDLFKDAQHLQWRPQHPSASHNLIFGDVDPGLP